MHTTQTSAKSEKMDFYYEDTPPTPPTDHSNNLIKPELLLNVRSRAGGNHPIKQVHTSPDLRSTQRSRREKEEEIENDEEKRVAFAPHSKARPSRFTITQVPTDKKDSDVSDVESGTRNTKTNRSLTVSHMTHELGNTMGGKCSNQLL